MLTCCRPRGIDYLNTVSNQGNRESADASSSADAASSRSTSHLAAKEGAEGGEGEGELTQDRARALVGALDDLLAPVCSQLEATPADADVWTTLTLAGLVRVSHSPFAVSSGAVTGHPGRRRIPPGLPRPLDPLCACRASQCLFLHCHVPLSAQPSPRIAGYSGRSLEGPRRKNRTETRCSWSPRSVPQKSLGAPPARPPPSSLASLHPPSTPAERAMPLRASPDFDCRMPGGKLRQPMVLAPEQQTTPSAAARLDGLWPWLR